MRAPPGAAHDRLGRDFAPGLPTVPPARPTPRRAVASSGISMAAAATRTRSTGPHEFPDGVPNKSQSGWMSRVRADPATLPHDPTDLALWISIL
jgi:hypothetical protein